MPPCPAARNTASWGFSFVGSNAMQAPVAKAEGSSCVSVGELGADRAAGAAPAQPHTAIPVASAATTVRRPRRDLRSRDAAPGVAGEPDASGTMLLGPVRNYV